MSFGLYTLKTQKNTHRVITFFLIFSALFTLSQEISIRVFELRNNLHIGNLWITVQFILLGIYYYIETKSIKYRKVQIVIATAYIFFTILEFLDVEKMYTFLSWTRYTSGIIFMFYSIISYYYFLKYPKENLLTDPTFWINTAIFIFFTGTIFIYLLIEFLSKNYPEIQGIGWTMHNFLGVVRAGIFGYAFYLIWDQNKRNEDVIRGATNA